MRKTAFSLLLYVTGIFSGCGYHHLGGGGSSSGELDSVHIAIFANRSYRSGLETMATQSVVDEFARHSGGNAVDEATARFVLSGAVLSYAVAPVSYTAADRIAGYRATVKLAATLVERQTGKIVWKGEVAESQDYPARTDIALQQNSEAAAIAEICIRLAEHLHEKMQEDF